MPVRDDGVLRLPIRGPITGCSASGLSIELLVPIAGEDCYCLHFGGDLEIRDPAGQIWRGRGDAKDQTSLAAVLGLIGESVGSASVDDQERLHIALAGGGLLTASRGAWEAHWPIGLGSLDEHWVPREGPSIP